MVAGICLAVPAFAQTRVKIPPELATLAAKSKLQGSLSQWCSVTVARRDSAYAIALTEDSAGRYMIVRRGAEPVELATFADTPDLSCYTPAEARALDRTLEDSETIEGHISPRSEGTVICGFIEPVRARCWQYSPAKRNFVKIGEWIT